jgi:glycosyltransferase involved in cell wall biosynthesis
VILNYLRRLRAKGHHVDLVGTESLELFPFLKKARSYRITLGMLLRTLRQLFGRRYDLIEFYGVEAWLSISLLRLLPGPKPVLVAHSNGLETHCHEQLIKHLGAISPDGERASCYQKIFNPPIARAFTQADGIVTVSEFDRDYAIANRYQPAERIVAIANPLSDEFLGLPVAFQRPQVLGFCGSWIPRKGVAVIRTDAAKLLRIFPECRLKLIGVGHNFVTAACFPVELCDRIEVIPFLETKSDLRRAYESLSILLMPSVYESFGLAAAEAMACGCALVAARTGFAASLEDRESAMLMEAPESPHLFECTRALLLDDELRIRVAQQGYARVQSLRWEEAANALEATYQSWIGAAAGA